MKAIFFETSVTEQQLLDGQLHTLIPQDCSIATSSSLFSLDLVEAGTDIVSIFVSSRISRDDIASLKARGVRKLLLRCAGYNMLDVAFAKELGIEVDRVAVYSPESVAEHLFALLLSLTKRLMVDRRKHERLQDGRDASQLGTVLQGKRIGFFGFGHIGQIAAKIACNGFGMQVYYCDTDPGMQFEAYHRVDSLESLVASVDILSIHVPLNDKTRGAINSELLSKANGLYLLNTARGGILNTEDCIKALDEGELAGLGLDVVDEDDSYHRIPLRDDIVFTQHTGFFTKEAVESIMRQTLENIHTPNPANVLD